MAKKLISFLIVLLVATTAHAIEDICPGGSSPDSNVIECLDFDDLTNCTTGNETTCLEDNRFAPASDVLWGNSSKEGFHIEAGGILGAGRLTLKPRKGSSGIFSTMQDFLPSTYDELTVRWYQRHRGGYLFYNSSSHSTGLGFTCSGGLDGFGLDNAVYPFVYHNSDDCVNYSTGPSTGALHSIQQTEGTGEETLGPEKWQRIEIHVKVDTSCTDSGSLYGCNGELQVWIDDTLIIDRSDMNWGGVVASAKAVHNWGPRIYNHIGHPYWEPEMDYDQFVWSVEAYTGDGNPLIGAATGEGAVGTAVPIKMGQTQRNPICADVSGAAVYRPYTDGAQLSRGAYQALYFRSSAITEVYPSNDHNLGLYGETCINSREDASLRVDVTGSELGAGIYHEMFVDPTRDTHSVHGFLYIPSGQTNVFTPDPVILAGFHRYGNEGGNWDEKVGLCVTTNQKLGLCDHNHPAAVQVIQETTTDVPLDRWFEFSVLMEDDGGNGTISLAINRDYLIEDAVSNLDLAARWMNSTSGVKGLAIGVMQYTNTRPFTVYYDEFSTGTASFIDCTGWGADCPETFRGTALAAFGPTSTTPDPPEEVVASTNSRGYVPWF
jgi:hypothetical protein